jgi:hypothetical protein
VSGQSIVAKKAMAFINRLSTRIVDQFKDRKVFVANNKAVAFSADDLSDLWG